ncbi:hypothetical protein DVH05_027116 [Phytophthora capsici]|nr:hypothetical protein DVH05_027116 [Phytophthora capsici]
MYARRLRQGEGVMDYINDLQRMWREVERMDVSLPEGEMASVVLSNAVNVYPSIANEHTQRVSRLRGGYDKGQRIQDAVNLLLVAERNTQEQKDRGNRIDEQGVQRQVNAEAETDSKTVVSATTLVTMDKARQRRNAAKKKLAKDVLRFRS